VIINQPVIQFVGDEGRHALEFGFVHRSNIQHFRGSRRV